MPRGIDPSILNALGQPSFEIPIYCVRITRGPNDVFRWADEGAAFDDGINYSVNGTNPDKPAAYWRLSESSGTLALDELNGAHNGTYVGGPTLGVAGALVGDANTAVTFNGSSQWISIPSITAPARLTLEAWIKTTTSADQPIWSNRLGSAGVYFGTSGGFLLLWDDSSTTNPAVSTVVVNDGAWHHVVVTSDGFETLFYVDGVAVGGGLQSRSASTGAAYIGYDVPNVTQAWNGSLDEVAIYNNVLTPERIAIHYQAGIRHVTYAPRIISINGITFSTDNAGPITIVASNLDGLITGIDRDKTFLGSLVEVLAYLPTLNTFYKPWSGWSDEITEISAEQATFTAYPTMFVPSINIPKRQVGLPCTNTFGNFLNWVSTRDFEGSECPYRRVSTIGFAANLVGAIGPSDTSITIGWNPLVTGAGGAYAMNDRLRIGTETVFITAATSPDSSSQQVLTVQRGYKGSVPTAHSDLDIILFDNCGYGRADCIRRGMYGFAPASATAPRRELQLGGRRLAPVRRCRRRRVLSPQQR